MDQPTAQRALAALEPLVGVWNGEFHWPSGEPWPGGGRSTFAWHPTKQFLIWESSVDLPEAPASVSIIGCDAANGTWSMLYADERNVSRVFTMGIDDERWTLERHGEPFAQRFIAEFRDGGDTMDARWEKAEDSATFELDFTVVYRRVRD